MRKRNKKLFITFLITFSVILIFIILQKNVYQYYIVGDNSIDECHIKKMVWDKGIYLINKKSPGKKLVLKVENRNKNSWFEMLAPVQSPNGKFKTCVKGITKFPTEIENSPATPSEIKSRSTGLNVSIGIQERFRYTSLADTTFTIRLFANKFNNDNYNLNVAMQDLSENIFITEESENTWRLSFNNEIRNQIDTEIPFEYFLVQVNGKDVKQDQFVEFISIDDGKTWKQISTK